VLLAWPLLFALWISLREVRELSPLNTVPVGWANYEEAFIKDIRFLPRFWQTLGNLLVDLPIILVFSLGVALLVHRPLPGRTFFRAVFFAPYVLGVAVVGLLWNYLLDRQLGPVNQILGALGLPGDTPWTTSLPAGWVALVVATVWWTLGFNTVIYLAALGDVPAELYDAAKVDGAGPWQRLWAVTVPGIRRVLQFVVMITIIASANMYGQSALITQEEPGTATRTAIGFIAHTGIAGFDIGSSSAMSMILAGSLMAVSALVFLLFRKAGDPE
jgi:multiple sugar transport system permease protein